MTQGKNCVKEGDFFAWGDMEWILHGQARIESVEKEDPCKGEPYSNLYYTKFQSMDTCMHHCEKLGSRVPSVTSSQDWATLQRSLKMNLYDKGLNTLHLWLPVNDRKTEGEWRDFYTGQQLENYNRTWVFDQQRHCAGVFLSKGSWKWGDAECLYKLSRSLVSVSKWPSFCFSSKWPGFQFSAQSAAPGSLHLISPERSLVQSSSRTQ